MRRLELYSAFAMLALSGFVIYATWNLAYWSRLVPGPGFMPFWVALATGFLSICLIATAYMSTDDTPADLPEGRTVVRLLITYAALWGVPLISPVLGFLPAAVLFMLFTLLVVYRQPLVPSLVTTGIIGAMVHFLFNQWLDVRLPTGILGV